MKKKFSIPYSYRALLSYFAIISFLSSIVVLTTFCFGFLLSHLLRTHGGFFENKIRAMTAKKTGEYSQHNFTEMFIKRV